MTVKRYALMKTGSGKVDNVILATEDYSLSGYILREVSENIYCNPGMYLNPADQLYYQEPDFKTIYPVVSYQAGSTVTRTDQPG